MPASSPPPQPSNEKTNPVEAQAEVAAMAAKQRFQSNAPVDKSHVSLSPAAPRNAAAALISLARRRRLSVYLIAFALMLLLSSVLDVRRAAFRTQASKFHLYARPPASSSDGAVAISAAAPDLLGLRVPHVVHGDGDGNPSARVRPALEHPALGVGSVGEGIGTMPGSVGGVLNSHHDGHATDNTGNLKTATEASAGASVHAAQDAPVAPETDIVSGGQSVDHRSDTLSVGPQLKPVNVDPNISAQELKDEVDQLIAHVDEETSKEAESAAAILAGNRTHVPGFGDLSGEGNMSASLVSAASGGEAVANTTVLESIASMSGDHVVGSASHSASSASGDLSQSPVSINSSVMLGSGSHEPGAPLYNDTTGKTADTMLSAEELFVDAQSRLKEILAREQYRALVDENKLRVIEALALQATRGDCEQPSASEGGSLFKSDAEAASQQDVERTEPLWGAWCIFMGTYKSDAMRDFVTKLRELETSLERASDSASASADVSENQKGEDSEGSRSGAVDTTSGVSPDGLRNGTEAVFNSFGSSLGDVMSADLQTTVAGKVHFLRSHLQDNELRYLGALALQASFGNCGPYGAEAGRFGSKSSKIKTVNHVLYDERGQEVRPLTEALTGETATRREGALWGAWCVLEGKDRSAAASELVDRTELLLAQLAKKQSSSESDSAGGPVNADSEAVPVLGNGENG